MKVRTFRIEDWDFDIKRAMKEMGYKSFREVGEKVGIHWTYINKIANRLACDEEIAGIIIRKMCEPIHTHFRLPVLLQEVLSPKDSQAIETTSLHRME